MQPTTTVPGFADTLRYTNTAALGLNPGNSNMNPEQQTNFMNAVSNARNNPGTNLFNPASPSVSSSATVSGANTTSSTKAFAPVVTSDQAQKDFNQKVAAYNTLLAQMKAQTDNKAKADMQSKVDAAAKGVQDANLVIQNKGLDIQKTQADAQKAAADAKLAATKGLTGDTTGSTTGGTTTTTTDTTGTAGNGTGTNTTGTNADSLLNSEATALSGVQTERQSAFNDYKSQVASIMNGTFPLSATEQSLVSATMASFERQKNDQQFANQADVGAVQEASFRSGGEYTPSIAAGTLANAISQGVSKIANLDAQAALTVANLEEGFQTKDYTMVNDLYDKLDKQLSDKSASIKSLFDTAIANEKDQRNYNLEVQKFNELKVKDAADIKNAADKFALDKANSVVDNSYKRAEIAKIFSDISTGDATDAANWAKNITAGTAKLSDVPTKLKNAVSVALANGNPQGVNSILQTTKTSIDELNQYVDENHGFTAAVGAKGLTGGLINGWIVPGSQAADFNAKLKQVTNDVVLPNLTILHGLGRVTDREFQALQSAVTSLNPNLSEGEFKSELKTITDTINKKIQDTQSDPSYQANSTLNSMFNISVTPTTPNDSTVTNAFSKIGL